MKLYLKHRSVLNWLSQAGLYLALAQLVPGRCLADGPGEAAPVLEDGDFNEASVSSLVTL